MPVFRTTTIAGVERLLLESRSEKVFNPNPFAIPAGRALCYIDGGVALADPTDDSRVIMAGVTTAEIPSMTYGWIIKTGPVPNLADGLSPVQGDSIFLSEVAGNLTATPPEAVTSAIVRIGYVVPNESTGLPTDLYVDIEVLTRP